MFSRGVKGNEGGSDGLGKFTHGGRNDLHGAPLDWEKPWFGSRADSAQIASSECLGCRIRIDETAANDNEFGIQRHGKICHMNAQRLGLKIKNFQREDIPVLRKRPQRKRFSFSGLLDL